MTTTKTTKTTEAQPKNGKVKVRLVSKKPSPLIKALQSELRALVESDALGLNLDRISAISKRAAELMMVLRSPEDAWKKNGRPLGLTPWTGNSVSPDVAEELSYGMGSASSFPSPPTAMGVETYGSTVIKQILPALKEFQQAQKETPQALVDALAMARRMGMTDVAAELEKKLCGKTLDGARPVSAGLATIGDYLPPTGPKLPYAPPELNGASKKEKS